MLGLAAVVDALGGVEIILDSPMGPYPSGTHHLSGEQALNFVRERSSSDDFSRMIRAQILLSAILEKALEPASWQLLPQFASALVEVIDTNIPLWQWPRLLFAVLRGFLFGLDSQTISREMVTPFQTSQGAQVLAPNWNAIQPLISRMFGG
jgi:anionic cell wall polymer biosynthesis LytR-Cps2A-Psr (LCP) family protein